MSKIKPVTVDTVYYAIKLFIKTNSILKQVLEDEFCKNTESIVGVEDSLSYNVWFTIEDHFGFSYRLKDVRKEQLVKIINNFIA